MLAPTTARNACRLSRIVLASARIPNAKAAKPKRPAVLATVPRLQIVGNLSMPLRIAQVSGRAVAGWPDGPDEAFHHELPARRHATKARTVPEELIHREAVLPSGFPQR